jgi:hypothetical protein
MPPLEEMDRNQDAVLWEVTGRKDRKGRNIITQPVPLKVQWDKVYRIRRNPDGTSTLVQGEVLVDRVIAVGSLMMLGTLDDWGDLGTGSTGVAGPLMEVVGYRETQDLKGRIAEKIVELSAWKKSIGLTVE